MVTTTIGPGRRTTTGDTGDESHTTRKGRAFCETHFGEILQGVRVIRDTHLVRCLVTLPCNMLGAEATFLPDTSGILRVHPDNYWKARRAAELALGQLGLCRQGGDLILSHNIPDKAGCGSSTACCVAACHAILDSCGVTLRPEIIGKIVVTAETAADSIMFSSHSNAVVFEHRVGEVAEYLPGPLPRMKVLGVNTDTTGAGVDTLQFEPAHYSCSEIEQLRTLIGMLRHGCKTGDAAEVASVATASARINQRFLEKPHFEEMLALVPQMGALGLNVSHSGTVVGFLFPPDRDAEGHMDLLAEALATFEYGTFWRFTVGV